MTGIVIFFVNKSPIIRKTTIIAISLVLAVFAYSDYDKRTESIKQSESLINQFKNNVVFPQIADRGKMFYYVSGHYVYEPRTQFLSGAYFSETSTIGEALFFLLHL